MTVRRDDGQTLVLFALVLVALVGISALVVDVGLKYSTERRYQAITDAAALAGAQELKPENRSTPVTTDMQDAAREAALDAIMDELLPGAEPPPCAIWSSCGLPGGQYTVSIITPSPACVDCEPDRAVKVTITEPRHSNSFAGVFGQSTWALSRTSVAGLSFGKSYAIVALRPPKPRNGSSIEVRDMFLNGGTLVTVRTGDVGTNSNMDYGSETNTLLDLDDGYRMYYYDPDPGGPDWGANPPGTHIGTLIEDPMYPIPAAPDVADPPLQGTDPACQDLVTDSILTLPKYVPLVPVDHANAIQWDKIWCYSPGSYIAEVKDGNAQLLTVLLPGLYSFAGGLDVNNAIVGGFDPAVGGVTLMFPRDRQFFQRAGSSVVLNAGTKFDNGGGDEPETAPVMTGTRPDNLKVTLIVQKDPACQVVEPYPTACRDPGSGGGPDTNQSLNLGGGAAIYLGGVQYGASDNIKIAGNTSGSDGYLGQIWAWTIEYVGSTEVNQKGLDTEGPGQIRIDTACSPGDTTCR